MKLSNRIISRRGFIMSSILGGFVAPFLKAEGVEASPIPGFSPQLRITRVNPLLVSLGAINTTYAKMGNANIGAFPVENPNSLVEITYQGRMVVTTFGLSALVYFELRVDDQAPLSDSGEAAIMAEEAGKIAHLTFSGIWQGLSQGNHLISMWVRTNSGTASGASVNPGGRSSDTMIIKEYLPFGSTYLPAIVN